MKRIFLLTAIIWTFLTADVSGKFIPTYGGSRNDCVQVALATMFRNENYATLPKQLEKTRKLYDTNCWKSIHTVRYYLLDKYGFAFIYIAPNTTVEQLAETKMPMLAITINSSGKDGHLIAIKHGDYHDGWDSGKLNVSYAMCNLSCAEELGKRGLVTGYWTEKKPKTEKHKTFFRQVGAVLEFFVSKAISFYLGKIGL